MFSPTNIKIYFHFRCFFPCYFSVFKPFRSTLFSLCAGYAMWGVHFIRFRESRNITTATVVAQKNPASRNRHHAFLNPPATSNYSQVEGKLNPDSTRPWNLHFNHQNIYNDLLGIYGLKTRKYEPPYMTNKPLQRRLNPNFDNLEKKV